MGSEVGMVPRTLARIALVLAATAAFARADATDDARKRLQTGKYAEAVEAYRAIEADDDATRARVAIGLADALATQGESDQAAATLAKAIEAQPASPDLLARLADLQLGRGLWDEAAANAKKAREAKDDHLLARWVEARLLEARGRRDEALAAWEWFIDYQNNHAREVRNDADALLLIGQASERYFRAKARGQELSQSLSDVINGAYEAAIAADPNCWQAPWLEAKLFLSGYQERDALKELTRAQRINPNAPEVLVTLGQADLQGYKLAAGRKRVEDALEINPHYAPAQILLADLNISDERFDEALEASKKALEENPKDEEALARLAASYRLLVDPVGAAVAEATAKSINPTPLAFYSALGERLADRRKYLSAERAFLLAIEADPVAAAPQIGLGMLYMQIGREDEANDLFDAAFALDPFNVRAKNMLDVLEHMAQYEAIETEHFSVLVLPGQDKLLGKYMARFLEQSYDDLVKRFGYEPPGKTKIEVMKDHMWFSGRTTALPFIPTVGACTGKVVALASTRPMKKPYNWSRVLVHEVTHVITLQQTEFNIPHWYTEALAVESEGTPRPQPWNTMLLERVPRRKLLNLDTINLGFIRPKEPEERQLAYCQAQLYAQYMVKRFGPDAQIKFLDAYRRGLTTGKAVKECFGVEKEDFEAGYLEFLDEVVETIRARVSDEEPVRFSELEQQVEAKPEDADLNARMAYEYFARRDLKAARPFADKALKLQPHHPLASYVKARLFVTIGDSSTALDVLRPALDEDTPNERVVDLLAELEMKEGNLDEAERLYELARQDDPYHSKWIAGLARVHLRQGDREALLNDLAMLAANDSDDLAVRQTLARYHLEDGRHAEAQRWATECLYIQVYDPAHHLTLADALVGQEEFGEAAEEYEVALELRAKKPNDVRVKLAKALLGAGRKDEAKAAVEQVLASDPEHPEAKALRDEMAGAAGS
jgi:tetratricopeptide (TPR) repeat protein